jgi:aspartate carbamoyltransferase catalytic subunit
MSGLSFTNLLCSSQINTTDIDNLFTVADTYRSSINEQKLPPPVCKGKILASLFFEPSTRTRFSFESAMLKLGGAVISLEQGISSSISKGESLTDTGRIISNYADIALVRHNKAGASQEFSNYCTIPTINAGDGDNQHPSQSLVDIYTIFCGHGRLNNLNIAVVGDLKYGRTVHSLLDLLSKYPNNHINLVSTPELALDTKQINKLQNNGLNMQTTHNFTALPNIIGNIDILYCTRIQQERLDAKENISDNTYYINPQSLIKAQPHMTIMHPLPRINEIDHRVDDLPYAQYFKQATYGLYIRMALLDLLVNRAKAD